MTLTFTAPVLLDSGVAHAGVAQDRYCMVTTSSEAAEKCNDGDVMAFFPEELNGQRDLMGAMAAFCDTNYSIAHGYEGGFCTYTGNRAALLDEIPERERFRIHWPESKGSDGL